MTAHWTTGQLWTAMVMAATALTAAADTLWRRTRTHRRRRSDADWAAWHAIHPQPSHCHIIPKEQDA